MKLRNAEIKELERCVNDLNLDLQAITQEYDNSIFPGSNEEILAWFHSLPIETLTESLNFDLNISRTKYSLCNMKHQFILRKLHQRKIEELENKKIELSIAKINSIISIIERI